jgi:hypothetical protein
LPKVISLPDWEHNSTSCKPHPVLGLAHSIKRNLFAQRGSRPSRTRLRQPCGSARFRINNQECQE